MKYVTRMRQFVISFIVIQKSIRKVFGASFPGPAEGRRVVQRTPSEEVRLYNLTGQIVIILFILMMAAGNSNAQSRNAATESKINATIKQMTLDRESGPDGAGIHRISW